jgi:hypothetical protein
MQAISPQELEESLLCAETAPGTALDKVAAFLVAAFEARRERGRLFSFQPVEGLPPVLLKRLLERDLMTRTRLKRLLLKGQRDGSLALRNTDTACALIFACLQATVVIASGPEQQMWDAELIELLLAALAEPHPHEAVVRRASENIQRAPAPGKFGPAPPGEAVAGATLSSSTSNFSSEPGGIGGGEFSP